MRDARRPVWAEVDLDAIRHNVSTVSARLANGARTMAVVKANAYGHGDVQVARAALDAGASWLGVILVDEAKRLRDAGIEAPILLLHEPPVERLDEVVALDLTPPVFTEEGARALVDAAKTAGRTIKVHAKVDTGLNRLGIAPDRLDTVAAMLARSDGVEVEAVFTHFAFADQPDHPFIDVQLDRFERACEVLASHGVTPAFRHVANSAAAITRPDAHYDMVRLGIGTYGLSPGPKCDGYVELRPAMQLKAQVARVARIKAGEAISYGHRYRLERDSTIASLPLGYADGWPRALSSNASVLIGGKRYPAAGTVCMDSFMVDLGDDDCAVGDEAVLIGTQGDERVTADEIAAAIGTINYEIVTRISQRVPRIYRG